MPEQNEQENLLQNQGNANKGSDLIKEDEGLLNGNTISEEGNEDKKKKRNFDLLGSTYEDSIWNSNLDGDKEDKNLPKTYPGKKWRNARAIVLTIDIVLSVIGLLTLPLEIVSTILMIIFIILWIKTIKRPENQEIIKEKNIGKRLKSVVGIYIVLTAIYAFIDVAAIYYIGVSMNEANKFDNRVSEEYPDLYDNDQFWDDVYGPEFDKIGNNAFGCDCYGDNATESIGYIDQLTSKKKIKQLFSTLKITVKRNIENGEWTY